MTPREIDRQLERFGDLDIANQDDDLMKAFYAFMDRKHYCGADVWETFLNFSAGFEARVKVKTK